MARVQQHGATPQRMPLADRPLKSRDRRAAHGNGTAFSAVAPSSGPYWPPVDPITREWSCPPGPNSWPLNIPAAWPVPVILRLSSALPRSVARLPHTGLLNPQTLSRICTYISYRGALGLCWDASAGYWIRRGVARPARSRRGQCWTAGRVCAPFSFRNDPPEESRSPCVARARGELGDGLCFRIGSRGV